MDKSKVETIQCWATPSSVKDVQRFLGFANFYHRFIKGYSKITTPLTTLTCKDKPFSWNPTAQAAFDILKMAFTSTPILIHPDPAKPFIMETDASDFALGAIISQFGIDGLLHLVAFYSRKLTSAEINYQVYDKELLAIITTFEQWRPYLAGAQHRVQVMTDHKNLLYFTTTRTLNRRQARWSIFLADFDFEIQYQPGTQQRKADALSRRSEYELQAGDEAYGQHNQTLLNLEQFRVAATISTLPDSYLVRDIKMATEEDIWATNIKKELQERPRNPNRDDLDQFEQQDKLLLRNNLIYVPEGPIHLKILRECHDNTLAGHFGMARTHELMSRNYWWPKMNKLLREYVKSCDTCARSKAPRHRPFGLL
jgi:hypothetical protein